MPSSQEIQELKRRWKAIQPYLAHRRDRLLTQLWQCKDPASSERLRGQLDELAHFSDGFIEAAWEWAKEQEKRG